MFVPRWVVLSLMVAAATIGGWLLHGFATDGFSLNPASSQSDRSSDDAPPVNVSVDGGDPKPVINLTVNTPGSTAYRAVSLGVGQNRGGTGSFAAASRANTRGSAPVQLTVQRESPGPGDPGYTGLDHDESLVSNDSRITVNGNHIVVASDGSIVFQGDDGSLNGNTGNSSAGGTIAIDNRGSDISTGTPAGRPAVAAPEPELEAGADVESSSAVAESAEDAAPGDPQPFASSKAKTNVEPTVLRSAARMQSTAELQATAAPGAGGLSGGAALVRVPGRSVSISGYEDHSITVDGNDQIILYDDSNVFINRDGQVNANTGDTDSSGLNVVDAVDSVVRSGNSGDGEGGGDDEDEEEEEDEDEAAPPPALAADQVMTPRSTSQLTALSALSGGSRLAASALPAGRASGSVDDEDTTTTATGDEVLVIGGDGYDDLAIRSSGDRNTVVYDDSNLVIGGIGGVNAQIGDSDTGGAVVMGVRNSFIEAGCEGDLCPLYDSGYHAAAVRQTGT